MKWARRDADKKNYEKNKNKFFQRKRKCEWTNERTTP